MSWLLINLARNEMSRDPVVWWSFTAAFGFMVAVVLAANLLADGVRDAFDPRARVQATAAGAPADQIVTTICIDVFYSGYTNGHFSA